MFNTVIFDLDGTLLNTLEDLGGAFNYTLAEMGFPVYPVEAYKKMLGGGLYNLINKALPPEHINEETIDKLLCIYRQYYSIHSTDKTAPYENIPEMLAKLKESGIKIAVASNKSQMFMHKIIVKYFNELFDAVEGNREGRPVKPDPSIIFDIILELDVNPRDVLYVGDSDTDMTAAANAGVKSAGVLWGYRSKDELIKSGACFTAENVSDLEKIILSN